MIEILTVGLDEATIEKVAQRVAQLIGAPGQWPQGGAGEQIPGEPYESYSPVTSSPEPQTARSEPVSLEQADPWQNGQGQLPPQQQAPQQQPYYNQRMTQATPQAPQGAPQQGQQTPTCVHGAMKYVPGGFSRNTNRAYDAFWACPTPRGAQDKCKSVRA